MQIILLVITVVLTIVLYKMLSSRVASYPFIRITRVVITDEQQSYQTTESEHGLLTIDNNVVIVDGNEYSLKSTNGAKPEAYLSLKDNNLISVGITYPNGEKIFFIDPDHSLYTSSYQREYSNQGNSALLSI